MLAALLLAIGCWRPDAYEPPPAPPAEEAPEGVADAGDEARPDGAGEEEAGAEGAGAEGAGAEEAGAGEPEGAPEEEAEEPAPFPAYVGRTLQAPVTIVDDYGRPLAVLGVPGVTVEVRGEEEARVRVWCGTCAPPVEGWIQAHLVERAAGTPTGGSK